MGSEMCIRDRTSGSVVSDTASTETPEIGNDSAEETSEASIDKTESTESDETE